MERARVPVAVLVILGIIAAAILAIIIWFATAGLRSVPQAGPTPTALPTTEPSPQPTSTPKPTATPTPAPTTTPAPPPPNPGTPPVTNPPAPPAPDITAPGLVTALSGTPAPRQVALSWTNPGDTDYAGAVVRRAAGSTPPATASAGTAVGTVPAGTSAITDTGLVPGAVYSYAVFSRDTTGNTSGAASATFTLPFPLEFATTDVDGVVTQDEGSGNLGDTGTLNFTVFDDAGSRTATVTQLTSGAGGTLTTTVTEPSGSTPGTVQWSYLVPNGPLRHLAAGTTLTDTFRVTIGDGTDSIDTVVTVVANGANDRPMWTAFPIVDPITSGQTTQFQAPADWISDPDDGESIKYTLVSGPAWLSIGVDGITFTVTPPITESGSVEFVLSAVDAAGEAARGGNQTDTTQKIVILVNQPDNLAPVASDDPLTWDLRDDASSFSANVLDNDTDDGLPGVLAHIEAVADGGVFGFLGEIAGDWSLASNGELTLTPSADPFGPLPKLSPGEEVEVELEYTVTDGDLTSTASALLTIVGGLDPIYAINPISGVTPDEELDASTSTTFGAGTVFGSPDPFVCTDPFTPADCDPADTDYYDYEWTAVSTGPLPSVFSGSTDTPNLTIPNSAWGAGADVTITVTAVPKDGRPGASASVHFTVGEVNQAPVTTDQQAFTTMPPNATPSIGFNILSWISDSDGPDPVSLVPSSGTWSFVPGPGVPTGLGGEYDFAADGMFSLNTGTSLFGAAQRLGPGQFASIELTYTATDGELTATGKITYIITGALDPILRVGELLGPDNQVIDYNDPTPSLFDATGMFVTADPYVCVGDWGTPTCDGTNTDWMNYRWSALSSQLISTDPAFVANADVASVTVPNTDWGFNAAVSVNVEAIANDGRSVIAGPGITGASDTINFFVGDGAGNLTVANDDTLPFDLRLGDWLDADSASMNLLGNDTGDSLSAVAESGTWKLDGDSAVAGTYSIATNGTITLTDGTDDFGPLQRLAPGETATAHLDYAASGDFGSDTASITIQVTGAADPLYRVGELQGPSLVDITGGGSSTFDASAMITGPDPNPKQYYRYDWTGESASGNPLPNIPALVLGSDIASFSVANNAWQIDTYTFSIYINTDGRPVVGGNLDTVSFTTTTGGGEPAPVANNDNFSWDMRSQFMVNDFTGNVLANDTPDGELMATSTTGDFTLDGQTQVAGSYVLYPDGTITLIAAPIRSGAGNNDFGLPGPGGKDPDDPDYFSPLSKLSPGETATITIPYEATSAGGADTASAIFTVTGRLDPVYQVRPLFGPDNVVLDFNDPDPTRFDASRMFDSPDPFTCGNANNCNPDNLGPNPTDTLPAGSPPAPLWIQYLWTATSSVTVPPDPAFIASKTVPWVYVPNNQWGFNADATVKITAITGDFRPAVSAQIQFFVSDASLIGLQDDTAEWDVRDDDTFSMNVLANDTGGVSAAPFAETFTVAGNTDYAGTYTLASDGTLTLTADPDGPLADLNTGDEATINLGYGASNGSEYGNAKVTITVVKGPPNVAPVATDDTTAFLDLRPEYPDLPGPRSSFPNPLDNDTDADGPDPLSAKPAMGTFELVGDERVAGTYSISSTGVVTITPADVIPDPTADPASPDFFSPLSLLKPGEQAIVELPYTVTDGDAEDSGIYRITITGNLDEVYTVAPIGGPNGVTLDSTSPDPVTFDATHTFASPDPFRCFNQYTLADCDPTRTDYLYLTWGYTDDQATLGAAFSGSNPTVTLPTTAFGGGANVEVRVTGISYDSREFANAAISFSTSGPVNHAPFADFKTGQIVMQGGDMPVWTGNVLGNTGDSDGPNPVSLVPASGTWKFDEGFRIGDVVGGYTIAADGTVTIDTGDSYFGPAQRLQRGEPAFTRIPFTVTDGSATASAVIIIQLTGALDPLIKVGELVGPDNQILDISDADPTLFDASGTWVTADPFYCDPISCHWNDVPSTLFDYQWNVSTNKLIPSTPAFHGADDTSFTVPNSAWGNGAEVTVSVMVGMLDNRVIWGPNVDTVTFAVGLGAGVDPPEANDDAGSWDLRADDSGFSMDVLANDTADQTLSAIAASGDFTLDGDDTVAGTYTLAADGTLDLVPAPVVNSALGPDDADYFSPLSKLNPGETATITLEYAAKSGVLTRSADAVITVTGKLDPVFQVRPLTGPDGQLIDFYDQDPTTFDASGTFDSPDPFACDDDPLECSPDPLATGPWFQYEWSATSDVSVPGHPAFLGLGNYPTLELVNDEWGLDSHNTLAVEAHPTDGRPVVAASTIGFRVIDPDALHVVDDTAAWGFGTWADTNGNNRKDEAQSFSTNVLTNDFPDGVTAVPSSGSFTLVGDPTTAGSYSVAADGTLTLTSLPVVPDASADPDSPTYFSPISLLNPGETAAVELTYTATDGVTTDGATVRITVTGYLDEIYRVRNMVGPDQQILDYNDPNPTLFDATNMFDTPDPFYCDPDMAAAGDCADLTEDLSQFSFIQWSWQAQSSVTVPSHPAFTGGSNVKSISAMNTDWGFNSACAVKVTAFPRDGRGPAVSQTIVFGVADGGGSGFAARGYQEEPPTLAPEPEPVPSPDPSPSTEPEPAPEPTDPPAEG